MRRGARAKGRLQVSYTCPSCRLSYGRWCHQVTLIVCGFVFVKGGKTGGCVCYDSDMEDDMYVCFF